MNDLTTEQRGALSRLADGEQIVLSTVCRPRAWWHPATSDDPLGAPQLVSVDTLGDLVRAGYAVEARSPAPGTYLFGITARGRAALGESDLDPATRSLRSLYTRQMLAAHKVAIVDGPYADAARRVTWVRFNDLRRLGYANEAHKALVMAGEVGA